MQAYEFDIDVPDDDDDEAFDGPDAYLEGDDNVLELEIGQDDIPAHSHGASNSPIAQILRCKYLAKASPVKLLSRLIC